jgi:murein DD-endopeptidase MepM/ murein hydrolase activator NlpD
MKGFKLKAFVIVSIFLISLLGFAFIKSGAVFSFAPDNIKEFDFNDYIETEEHEEEQKPEKNEKKNFIKWVEFNVTLEALNKACNYDVKSYGSEIKLNWIELLAYAACRNGNRFTRKSNSIIDECAKKLKEGKSIEELTKDFKYYGYYYEAFDAVLGKFLDEYIDLKSGERRYGLAAYFPLAGGYWFNSYDDFGAKRGYGFARRHLGNDLMGSVGTPVIAVEGGSVYEVGWNRFGGWRIGIMSGDGRRYYYYAHLRKDKPYYKDFKKGDAVEAGDILGYMGNTGYSMKPNTNMKGGRPHLHYGLQLIFDESQIDSPSEIWIDNCEILKFLQRNKAKVKKDENGEVVRVTDRVKPVKELPLL